jgi:hypothetical protein
MELRGIAKGAYMVEANEVKFPFIAYWNGHKWVHNAMKYNIKIHTWIRA